MKGRAGVLFIRFKSEIVMASYLAPVPNLALLR